MKRNGSLRNLEVDTYKKKIQPLQFYLMLDELTINWYWEEREVKRFDQLWKQGRTISEISQLLHRPKHEVELLKIDRMLKGVHV